MKVSVRLYYQWAWSETKESKPKYFLKAMFEGKCTVPVLPQKGNDLWYYQSINEEAWHALVDDVGFEFEMGTSNIVPFIDATCSYEYRQDDPLSPYPEEGARRDYKEGIKFVTTELTETMKKHGLNFDPDSFKTEYSD